MRVAFAGVGRIGTAHARVVRDHPEVDSVVLSDADGAKAQAVAVELGVEAAESVEKGLTGADALVVAASTASHADLVLRGIREGIPVFCEKPVAPDVAGSRRVLAEVESAGAVVQIGFQRRFDSGYNRARAAVSEGLIGELRRVHLLTADQAPPPAEYIPLSGGIFRDCHVHDFDMLRWVTGREVVEVTAVGANRGAAYFAEGGDVDESAGVMSLDDGTLVTMQGSRYNGGGHDIRMEVAGTRSTYVVGLSERSPVVSAEQDQEFPGGEPWPNYWERFKPAYVAELQAFVELVQGRRENPCSVADALEAFYIAEAATISWRERRTVTLEEVRSR
jgi:predicted dehydrogenase